MKNIVLVGMMGSGKSTVGKLIASELTYDFLDSDSMIEEKEKRSINDMFEKDGEGYFRKVESEVIASLTEVEKAIISTGGGVILNHQNVERLRTNGMIFLLNGDADTLYNRLYNNADDRPLLDNDGMKEKIISLLEVRETLYLEAADYVIELDDKSPDLIVREILDIYCNQG